MYVSGLAWSTDDAGLAAHFSKVGRVVKATVLTRVRRSKVMSLGCGLVEFATPAEAAKAIVQMNNTEIDGRKIACREDRKGDAGDEVAMEKPAPMVPAPEDKVVVPNKVFVRSLAWTTTDQSLHAFFSTVGRVISAEVKTNSRGRSSGSGVVEFADSTAATAAIALLDEKELDGRMINVRHYYEN